MKTNDVAIAYVSWPGGGKRRPVYIIDADNGIITFFKVTSKYAEKSDAIKRWYYPIQNWRECGLRKPSYIDTISTGQIMIDAGINVDIIGHLALADQDGVRQFLQSN